MISAFAFAMLILPQNAQALTLIDGVNIGDATSEAGYNLVGWGPIVEPTSGWGGGSDDGTLRVTWAPGVGDNDPSASFTLDSVGWFGTTLKLNVLDGIANDDFEVYEDGYLIYTYTCDPLTNEYWVLHEIPLKVSGIVLITIKATGPAWSGINTYGQLGVSSAELWGFEQGFDDYGYNYQAHMFNGWYPNAPRPETPYEGTWKGDGETWLSMKWNDAWISNMDRDGDQQLDRHYGYSTYTGSGAWLTNHQKGWYIDGGKLYQWTYFVKIVAPDYVPTDTNQDGLDDASGARIIWGSFLVIQSVYNDKHGGYNGILELVKPAGFGAY